MLCLPKVAIVIRVRSVMSKAVSDRLTQTKIPRPGGTNPNPPQMTMKTSARLYCSLLALAAGLFLSLPAQAQLDLSTLGTNYTQNFDSIGSGLPAGWTVNTGATASNLGTVASFVTAATTWATPTGNFRNCASASIGSGGTQSTATDRCPAVRQTGSFGDPGAAFELQISNTVGYVNFSLSLDLMMLSVQTFSTVWSIQYGIGGAPTNFTTLATYFDPGVFGTTHTNIAFQNVLDNQPTNVWIRIVALSAATGSGSRDTFGIDNFSLSWNTGTTSITNPPSIISQPLPTTAVVGTSPILSVGISGTPPLSYQWYKNGSPLTDGGNITGSTNSVLTFSSVLHSNAGNYYVVITNSAGLTNSTTNSLTIVGFVMSHISNTNTLSGVPVTGLPLTFTDPVPGISTVTGTSANTNLLLSSAVIINGSGNNRTVNVSPIAGSNGVAVATVTASDGTFSTNTSFAMLVVPNTNVLFNDNFTYPDGAIITNSAAEWVHHSGTIFGEMQVSNHTLLVSQALDEDASALLLGAPYSSNSTAVLYSKFTVTLTDLPSTAGTYFAHFKNVSASGFHALVWSSTSGTNIGGTYRLGIGNSSAATATSGQFPMDLTTNTPYVVVTRLVVSNGISTIWINPTNETDSSVTGTDTATFNDIAAYAFRESGTTKDGKVRINDLVIGNSFAAVMPAVIATLKIQKIGTNTVLTWNDPSLYLQSSPTLNGSYAPVCVNYASPASPFTNTFPDSTQFYKLGLNNNCPGPSIIIKH